jgi:hypothetical protein
MHRCNGFMSAAFPCASPFSVPQASTSLCFAPTTSLLPFPPSSAPHLCYTNNCAKHSYFFFFLTPCMYINVAVSEHLRTILASLIRVSDHRLEVHKDELPFTVTSEPRKISISIRIMSVFFFSFF